MLRALSMAMTILLLLLPALAGAAAEPGGNAALKYWQAFATLPKFTDAQNEKIGEPLTAPLDDSTGKILSSAEYSLTMLHRGAALRRCDWGIGYEDGVFVLLPHASAARVLGSLACLRGRQRFEAGQSAEAIDDLVAAVTLGRQVSLDGTLITLLVGYHIERQAIDTLAIYLPKLDAPSIKVLKTRLDALPSFGSQAAALLTAEKESMDWFIRKVKETKDKESLLAFLSWVDASEGEDRNSGGKAAAFLEECGGTAEGVIKFASETLPYYAATAKSLDLPLDQFEKEFARDSIKRAGNPVYKLFFPALQNARKAQARADVRRALLSAAMAVQVGGQDALKDHPDPVVGGPFEYASFKNGFELRSQLKGQDDKRVTLTVGRRDE